CALPFLGLALPFFACNPQPAFPEAIQCDVNEVEFQETMRLGGKIVSKETLEQGREAYTHYCRACHGACGDGRGPASKGLRPPPRDFRLGQFKFIAVKAGDLPSDDDLKRIILGGLKGTAMLPWDVPEDDVDPIIQYIKTFSTKWQKKA